MSFTSTIMKKNSDGSHANMQNTIEQKKESMNAIAADASKEFSNLVADIEDLVKATTSLTGEELVKARKMLNDRLAVAKQSIDGVSSDVMTQARKTAAATDNYVRAQPWQVIGAGAAFGVLLGYVIGRKG